MLPKLETVTLPLSTAGSLLFCRRQAACVIAHDLPTVRCFFQNQQEVTIGCAAAFGLAFQVKVPGAGRKVRVERLNLQLRKAQRAHASARGIVPFVPREHPGVAVLYRFADKQNVCGVFITRRERVQVTPVPVRGLPLQQGRDPAARRRWALCVSERVAGGNAGEKSQENQKAHRAAHTIAPQGET